MMLKISSFIKFRNDHDSKDFEKYHKSNIFGKTLKSNKTKRLPEKTHAIISIGLTIHDAPVGLREEFAINEAEWPRAIEELCRNPNIEEAAVLSTCNRMELYIVSESWHQGVQEAENWISKTSNMEIEDIRPYLFLYKDQDAVLHLLRVSGGLDSLVLGEGQILAQTKQVHKIGQDCPGYGRHLSGLFKQAISAGKRVRTQTSISTGGVSVSSAAVELLQLKLPTKKLSDARISIIGAGKMSALLVKHLISKGTREVTIINRSLPRAESLKDANTECEIKIRLMSDLNSVVSDSDAVFAASGSKTLVLLKDDIAAMPRCGELVGGIRRFVDISVPRNIDPRINDLENHSVVYNVDDLKEVVAVNKDARVKAAEDAQNLLQTELHAFDSWRDSLETVPTIKALRAKAETIRNSEFERSLVRLGGLSKKQLKTVEELSKSIVNKLLHGPMASLRCDGKDSDAVGETLLNMEALERMFSLSQQFEKEKK